MYTKATTNTKTNNIQKLIAGLLATIGLACIIQTFSSAYSNFQIGTGELTYLKNRIKEDKYNELVSVGVDAISALNDIKNGLNLGEDEPFDMDEDPVEDVDEWVEAVNSAHEQLKEAFKKVGPLVSYMRDLTDKDRDPFSHDPSHEMLKKGKYLPNSYLLIECL